MNKGLLNLEISQYVSQAFVPDAQETPLIERVKFNQTAGFKNPQELAQNICQQPLILYPDKQQVTAQNLVNALILKGQVFRTCRQGF